MTSQELIARYNELSSAMYLAEQMRDEDGCLVLGKPLEQAQGALLDFEAAHPELSDALIEAANAR
jgi:hypothetical protein